MDNGFIQAMRFRYACKKFDTTRSIPPEVFESILESGRLSPSSFGMEPTRLLVVRDKEKKERLKALCWNQDQITQASELVVYLSKIADMRSDTNYAMWSFMRKGINADRIKAYKDERYKGFLQANGYVDSQSIFQWSARQAYIVASSMMDCAAYLGVDSCAIEGFEKDGVERFLGLDTFAYQVALIMTFGYRLEEPKRASPRIDINDFVQYI